MSVTPMISETPRSVRRFRTRLWQALRELHLWAGLFSSPFLVVFAVSAILLNHGWGGVSKVPTATKRQVAVVLSKGATDLARAQEMLRQAHVDGEVDYFWDQSSRVHVVVSRPTWRINVTVDLAGQTAQVEERRATLAETLVYLHKYPGPHLADLRGNWFFTRLWGVLADSTVYLLLLALVTGVYLWLIDKSQWKAGLVFLAAGCVSFALILVFLMR